MPLSGPRTLRAIGWQSKIVARDSKAARNRTPGVTLPRACGSDRSGSSHIDRWRQTMAKSTVTYWNALKPENREMWKPVDGLEGMAEELTLSIDESTGGIHKAHTFPAWRRYHGVRRQDPPLSRGSVRRRRPYSRRGLRPLAGSWPLRNPPTRGASRPRFSWPRRWPSGGQEHDKQVILFSVLCEKKGAGFITRPQR